MSEANMSKHLWTRGCIVAPSFFEIERQTAADSGELQPVIAADEAAENRSKRTFSAIRRAMLLALVARRVVTAAVGI
jgi:hypothetical protein